MSGVWNTKPRVLLCSDIPDEVMVVVTADHPDLEIRCSNSNAALPALLESYAPEVVNPIRLTGTPGYPRDAFLGSPSVRRISVGGSNSDHLLP